MIERFDSPDLHRPVGCYRQAVRCGGFVVSSGQASLDRDGRVVAPGDAAGQTRQTLGNLRAALAAAGAGIEDVVRVTVYLADYGDYRAMDDAFRQVFGAQPPARATLRCALFLPDLLVEMDAWAWAPDPRPTRKGERHARLP